jgi:phosphoenolpyruvate carboxylase
LQIELLKEWRIQKQKNSQNGDKLLGKLLMITNAISGGLKNTG